MDKKMVMYIALVLAGVVLADRIRALPGLNRIPSI